jgi:hypothetical protein
MGVVGVHVLQVSNLVSQNEASKTKAQDIRKGSHASSQFIMYNV